MSRTKPHAESRLAKFIAKRILELAPRKSQVEIAAAAGFNTPNVLSMIKGGTTKLPLDRVPALAAALETDPKHLFLITLDQHGFEGTKATVAEIFGTIVTKNEAAWLAAIREASDHSDPALTSRGRAAVRGIFNK
jgi:hypothetical protein